MSRSTRAWSLWRDWCTASGHGEADVTEAALAAFSNAVPGGAAAVLSADLAVRRRREGLGPDRWTSVEATWAPLEASLVRCPVYGWPQAVPGRRDAWLVVATRVLRLPRRLAVGLRAHDLPSALSRLPEAGFGEACTRCVALRWLDVVHTHAQWSRSSVRAKVWSRPAGVWSPSTVGSAVPCGGACGQLGALVAGLPGHTVVAPAIDRHGWWTDWRPMSTRALTTVLSIRCDPYGAAPLADEPAVEDLRPLSEFDDSTFERLDAAMDAADELNARLEALLAEHGG